ncbi:MAG: molecular chaperone DnaJ [Patescibacteria group bacterium]|nr:molecular chaperone DnaJ [Patescibacteria group bacterium]
MGKDYYKILGVNKNASPEEIKKAFRKLAHECHPDKPGGDEKRFKELNEAYQVLGNPHKRQQYDQFGSAFEQAQSHGGTHGFRDFRDFSAYTDAFGQNGANFNFNDMEFDLGDILSSAFGFSGFDGQRSSNRSRRGQDIKIDLTLNFEEAVFGVEKKIKITKNIICQHCQGKGVEPGSQMKKCSQCGGRGQVRVARQTMFGTFQSVSVCPDCQGKGEVPEKKCSKCNGLGIVKDESEIEVKVPAGIHHGEILKLSGQGQAGQQRASAGDLYIHIAVKPHTDFNRQGDDILSERKINFSQAALGDKIKIQTLHGDVMLKIPAGTQSGKIFKLKNKGVPKLRGYGKGDHLVKIIVKTPESLTREQKKIFEELQKIEE